MSWRREGPGGALPFRAYADFFDGRTAASHRVTLGVADEGQPSLVIALPERAPVSWPFASIRRIRDMAGEETLVITSERNALARLEVRDAAARELIESRASGLDRSPPVRGLGRVLAWAGAALASVALILLVLVPAMADRLAEFLPPGGEKALGDTTLGQIRAALDETGFDPVPVCRGPGGQEALAAMEARLLEGRDIGYELTVTVLDHPMINAFALPGGHVVFFRGLIDAAETPEEIAAVFAHEIGHVAARDPARIALRSAGSIGILGLLLGDFAGGSVVLFLAERIIQADYTREAEAAADAFAHAMLLDAGLSPAALGDMFRRLREAHGDAEGIVAHFLSHPALGDRIAEAEAAARTVQGPRLPLLEPAAWAALQAICD